jgi:hypothetical protein
MCNPKPIVLWQIEGDVDPGSWSVLQIGLFKALALLPDCNCTKIPYLALRAV